MRIAALLTCLSTFATVLLADFDYPPTPTVDHVDNYHGTEVSDPYRWLEDLDSPETAAWVEAQNQVTFAFLNQLPERAAFEQRLTELYNYARYSLPFKQGGRYFYEFNTGLQNQSPLYVKSRLEDEGRLLLDPNTLSADGTVALTAYTASEDGQWLAYATSTSGSDWREIRVRNIATGEDTEDLIQWAKFTDISWTHDSRGFFYSRFPAPAVTEGAKATFSDLADQTVYYHRLGTPQSEDIKFYAIPEHPQWGITASVSEDGRYLMIPISEGTDPRNRMRFLDLKDPANPDRSGEVQILVDELEASYNFIGNEGSTAFFLTDLDAPRYRIIAIDLDHPDRENWRTIVPEGETVIESAGIVGGQFIVKTMQDARNVLSRFALDGTPLGEVDLPGLGAVDGFSGRHDEPELFFNFASFTTPRTNFRADLSSGEVEVFQQPEVPVDLSRYETRQVFYASKDGTRVPMFITMRKGIALDGSHPTLLYGYGGFNISLLPHYSSTAIAWLEMGGIYAVPNLRGGGEYGQQWHLAGTKERKQNVFDDFAAAGDYLVAEGYTSHRHLAIRGGSNGGLLVAATLLQRPDLARAALPAVGVLDMLRFHKFTIGWAWTPDYGSADDPEGFAYLHAYSPLHNIESGVDYPATLITTADHDDRVHPAHSFKFAAAMQAANPDPKLPTFIRIETKAGHGAGRPISKIIATTADELAFAHYFTTH